jgi:hypothetical protein
VRSSSPRSRSPATSSWRTPSGSEVRPVATGSLRMPIDTGLRVPRDEHQPGACLGERRELFAPAGRQRRPEPSDSKR